jgi:hypothetical protein
MGKLKKHIVVIEMKCGMNNGINLYAYEMKWDIY